MKDESNQRPGLQSRPGKIGLYDPAFEHDACGVGFIAHVKGERSHQILVDASTMLCHVDHRGARGSEQNTGDGAGILTALPHRFLERIAREELHASLPDPGRFAAGLVFLPTIERERAHCKSSLEALLAEQGQRVVGWREVPVDPDACDLGPTARAAQPRIELVIVAAAPGLEGDAFERQIYLARKRASHLLRGHSTLEQAKMFYVSSLSTKVIIYKGMLTASQLFPFFPDLSEPDYDSHLAMIHSRFSTNTFPSWDRAQPNRFMAHNGEINTLRGNMNWMQAREGMVESDLFGAELDKAFPVVEPDCSDSGTFDNVLEFLLMNGRTLQRSIMMMIPEAWQNDPQMSPERRAFYEYHSCLLEPWDGPASIAFTDGRYIGAVLDRNGLRPSRYYLTTDDLVIMASEVGVLPIAPERVLQKGRLQPGRMFLVDFEQGRVVADDELKAEFCGKRPYGQWLAEQKIELDELPRHPLPAPYQDLALLQRLQAHGYTVETVSFMLRAIVEEQRDPVGSMGNDAALAILSDQPRMLYDYFKQLFAQVTNPAIDSIREEVVMSLECYIGPERNLLQTTPEHAHRLRVPHPILTDEELEAIKHLDYRGWKSSTIDITWPRAEGEAGMQRAIARICAEAEQAIAEGYQVAVLSDRAVGPDRVAISALLACGAVHHHLIRKIKRTRIALVLETAEAREVHHHCLLVGYGADAINPYLAFASLCRERKLGRLSADEPRRCRGDRALPQGGGQGDAQGDGEDGDLDAPELQGSADLRGGRPARRGHRALLRRHREPHPGRRVRRSSPQEAIRRHELGYPAGGPGTQVRAAQPRPHPLARQRRGAHVDAGDHRGDPGGGAHQQPRRLRAVREAGQRARRRARARCAACSSSRTARATPCRSKRSSRRRTSSSASAPAR